MKKIATHDSVTGEKPLWFCWPLTIFARTQTKNIDEQFYSGCRMFDIRVKRILGQWRGAHGWWFTRKNIEEILDKLNKYAYSTKIIIFLTYEGKAKNSKDFVDQAKNWKEKYNNIVWGDICAKYSNNSLKVQYSTLIPCTDCRIEGGKQAFLPLDGKHWQTYIPIPILWKQFYFRKVDFDDKTYKFVDFL